MFLQALADYADFHLSTQLDEVAFESKRVAYLIELDSRGRFLGVTDCQSSGRATFLPVPRSPRHRTGGICPLLACDNLEYVLGAGDKNVAFVRLIEAAKAAARDLALETCLRFYANKARVNDARRCFRRTRPAAGAVIALSMGGPVILREKVRSFWREHYAKNFEARLSIDRAAMCMVSGQIGPVVETHEKIKSVSAIGGPRGGASLISFGAKAFNSYGWQFGVNCPVSAERESAYTLGLNYLLRGGSASRVDHGGTAFLHWTDQAGGDSPMALLERPQASKIATLAGSAAELGSPGDHLHVIGISANSGRLIVRCSLAEDLDRVRGNLAAWFADLSVTDAFTGGIADAPRMAALLSAMARGGRTSASTTVRLYQRALLGEHLGLAELSMVLQRRRAASGTAKFSPALAALIRLCVNDCLSKSGVAEGSIPPSLHSSIEHPSYLCGRLLALCDALEYQIGRRHGLSVSDRYYPLLSPGGGTALSRLLELSSACRRRLRLRRPWQKSFIVELLEQIEEQLCKSAARLSGPLCLEDQGQMALGFHHQSAANTTRAQLRDRERPDQHRRHRTAYA